MSNIKFDSGYCIKINEEYELINLVIDDVRYDGSTKIDNSTDLGKAVLAYLKDNPQLTRDFTVKSEPTEEEIKLQKQAQILEIKKKVTAFFDEVAQARGYINSTDCLSFLNSTNAVIRKEAQNFNTWRDACVSILREKGNKYLLGSITLTEFSEDAILAELPCLYWNEVQKEEDKELKKTREEIGDNFDLLTLEECKATRKAELLELIKSYTTFESKKVFFSSSVRQLMLNGDFRSERILTFIYESLADDEDTAEIRLYNNYYVTLTKSELATVIRELKLNMRNILQQKWQYIKDIEACETKDETKMFTFEIHMTFF